MALSSTSTTDDQSSMTPVEASNQSASIRPNNLSAAAGGGMSAAIGGGNALTAMAGSPTSGGGPAPAATAAPPAAAPVATPPAPVSPPNPTPRPTTAAAAAVPTSTATPGWASFLNSRNVGYSKATQAKVSGGVGAEGLNPLFGTRLAQAIADGERIVSAPLGASAAYGGEMPVKAVLNEMVRTPQRQAQYYADYRGRPVTYGGKTYQPDPAKLGRIAAPPGASRHQKGEAVDFSSLSPDVRDYVRRNARSYGLQILSGGKDIPHVQLDRNNPLSQKEADQLVAGMGFPSIQEYQAARGITVDGIVGPQTRGKLIADMANPAAMSTSSQVAAAAAAEPRSVDTLTAADRNAARPEAFDLGMLGVRNPPKPQEPKGGYPVPSDVAPELAMAPADWTKFQRDLQAGNVPWDRLPPTWRDEMVQKLGPNAKAQYDATREQYVASSRGGQVVGETQKAPEVWGKTGTPNGQAIMAYYTDTLGMPAHMAAGFVGNFAQESYPDIRPTAYNEGEDAYGAAQWRGDRLKNLKAFPAKVAADPELRDFYQLPEGADYTDLYTQAAFAHYEAQRDGIIGKLENADTAAEAAGIIAKDFERTADKPGDEGYENRVKWARAYAGEDGDVQAQTVSPAVAAAENVNLRRGSRSPQVAAYQMMLSGMGYYAAGIDQDFGKRTDAAVRKFQADHGLTVDGVIGPQTSAAIEAQWANKVQNPRPAAPALPVVPEAAPPPIGPRPITPEERSRQMLTRGGPVDMAPVIAANEAARYTDATRVPMVPDGSLGNEFTALSLQDAMESGQPLPSIEAAIALRRAANPNINRTVGTRGDRLPTAAERAEQGGAINRASVNIGAKSNPLPAGVAPDMTIQQLREQFPAKDPDTVKGGAGGDVRGDPGEDRLTGVDWFDKQLQKGREEAKGAPEGEGGQAVPGRPENEPTRPAGAVTGQAPRVGMGRRLDPASREALDQFIDFSKDVGVGALRGGEDTLATVADAIGFTVTETAAILADEGVISREAADAIAASEEARDQFVTQRREEWEAEHGQSVGANIGRVAGQVAATAAPVAATFQAARFALRGAPAVAEWITGGGNTLSKMAGGALAGTAGELFTASKSDEAIGDQLKRGAIFGAAGGYAFGKGGEIVDAVKDMRRVAGTGTTVNRGAIAALSQHLDDIGMTPDEAIDYFRKNPDARVYQADPSLAAEAGSLANAGNKKATSIIKKATKDTAIQVDDALLGDMDRILGPARNGNQVKAVIAEDAKNRAGPLYAKAKSRGIALDVQPALDALDNAVIAGRPAQNAIAKAKEALYDRSGNLAIDVDQVHAAREALDALIRNPPKATPSRAINAMREARNALNTQLKSIPEMAQADQIWAGNARLGEAFDLGTNIWKTGIDDFTDAYNAANATERVAIAAGARQAMADAAAVNGGPLSGMTGKVFRNPDNTAKLRMAFGPQRGQEALDAIAARLDERAASRIVGANSETASRLSRKEAREAPSTLTKAAKAVGKGAQFGGLAALGATGDVGTIGHGMAIGGGIAGASEMAASKIQALAVARREAAMAAALTMKGEDAIKLMEAVKAIRGALPGAGDVSRNKLVRIGGSGSALSNEENRRRLVQGRTISGYRDSMTAPIPTGN